MEWKIDDGINVNKVNDISDIAKSVQNVMEEKCEFMILEPSEQVNGCNYMQVCRSGPEIIYIEANMFSMSDMNSVFCAECSTDKAIRILTAFCSENTIPDLNKWVTGGMEVYYATSHELI